MARRPCRRGARKKPARAPKRRKPAPKAPPKKRPASAREGVLNFLKERKRTYTSGEEIGKALNISRAAVWKHIALLRKEGHVIESHRRKGYRLVKLARK